MLRHRQLNRALWFLTGVVALVAATGGLLRPEMYAPVVSVEILPGVFTQDLLAAAAALVILVLAWRGGEGSRGPIVAFGALGFLFYAYGIYAIEQVYTPLYPLYLAVMALCFHGLAFGLADLRHETVAALELPGAVRYGSAAYAVFIAVLFNVVWLARLAPLLRTGDRIEYTFSVFVIDLVFIMPAFVIAAVLAVRRNAVGVVGLPALFLLGAGILSPLALAELLKPVRYGLPTNVGELWLFGTLALVFVILAAAYLARLRPASGRHRPPDAGGTEGPET